jgi:hypothetical protein
MTSKFVSRACSMVWAAKHFHTTKSAFSVLSVTDEQGEG